MQARCSKEQSDLLSARLAGIPDSTAQFAPRSFLASDDGADCAGNASPLLYPDEESATMHQKASLAGDEYG